MGKVVLRVVVSPPGPGEQAPVPARCARSPHMCYASSRESRGLGPCGSGRALPVDPRGALPRGGAAGHGRHRQEYAGLLSGQPPGSPVRGGALALDNLETLLSSRDREGSYLPGYEGYGRLIGRLAESAHQSCACSRCSGRRMRPQRAMVRPTSSPCSKRCGGTCAAWTSPGSSFAEPICKMSSCRIQAWSGQGSRRVSGPRPLMPSGRLPSARAGSTGPRAASGEKYGCGAREARSCIWPGRRIPILRWPSPLARTNASSPAGAWMAASSCGTSRVELGSGQAGRRRGPPGWPLPPMGTCSPAATLQAPFGSGRSRRAGQLPACRRWWGIRSRCGAWRGVRMEACWPVAAMTTRYGCGKWSGSCACGSCRATMPVSTTWPGVRMGLHRPPDAAPGSPVPAPMAW
jgi:hypothetical protein